MRSEDKESHSHSQIADLSKTGCDEWGRQSPSMTQFMSRPLSPWSQAAQNLQSSGNKHEPEKWGPSHVDLSRSRCLSPWSRAAQEVQPILDSRKTDGWGDALDHSSIDAWSRNETVHRTNRGSTRRITGRYHSRSRKGRRSNNELQQERSRGREQNNISNTTDGWGNIDRQTIPDSWNHSRSNCSPDGGFSRQERHVSRSSDRNNSIEPKWRIIGPECSNSHKVEWSNTKRHLDKSRGRKKNNKNSINDGWGHTDHHTIPDAWNQSRSNLSPDGGFDRRTSGCNWSGPGVRNSSAYHPKEAQTDTNWSVPGVASSSVLILDVNQKKGRDGIVLDKASSNPQFSSQNHWDVKGKSVMNSHAGTLKSQAINTFSMDLAPAVHTVGTSQRNPDVIMTKGDTSGTKTDEVDNSCFKWALIGFAMAKLRPFLVKQHFSDEIFILILRKFVENVARSLGPHAPQTDENSRIFIKEQDKSLSNFLDQTYLQRYADKEIMKKTRDEQKNAT